MEERKDFAIKFNNEPTCEAALKDRVDKLERLGRTSAFLQSEETAQAAGLREQ